MTFSQPSKDIYMVEIASSMDKTTQGCSRGHESPGAAHYPAERKSFLEKAVPVLSHE